MITQRMAVPPKKSSWIDPSKKAGNILDSMLQSTSEEAIANQEIQSSTELELSKAPLTTVQSDRQDSRVLFITKDASVLESNSALQLHFINLSDVFNEIHILVLCEPWQSKVEPQRLGKNIWAYTTSVKYWPWQMAAALTVARDQLTFAEGFRPDIVVALDPFESGLSGLLIAEKYDREFQVHISEDLYAPEFVEKSKGNGWRLRIASYVLKRVQSVRVATETLKASVLKRYPDMADLELLPRHYDIQLILKAAESMEVQDAFPQYAFVILFVGKLDHNSTLFRTLDASRSILRAKSIGMAVVGDGPNKKEFEKRAEILGIKEQIIFQKDASQLLQYLKSADVLLCSDITEASDEVVIKAAAAGLPIIASETQLRKDLFKDGESAFLCNSEDTVEFAQKLSTFLNTNSLRTQFAQNARDIVKNRLHEDPNAFKLAYRDAIEGVFGQEMPAEEALAAVSA
jgi:glycosyltransferase involved in cell wall biosynthesis